MHVIVALLIGIIVIETRMTTIIKAKIKKSDDQMSIDKVAANITNITYYIKINLPKNQDSKIHDKDINVCKNQHV